MIVKKIFIVLFAMLITQIFSFIGDSTEETKEIIEIDIPDYTVEKVDGYDEVTIPEGNVLCIPGNPMVPYYTITRWYPDNYEIQNVTLLDRTVLKTESGLNIKTFVLQWGGDVEDNTSFNSTEGWYPKQNYTWFTDDPGNGSLQLTIIIFPFFYNNSTKESKFYNHYSFQVKYIVSKVEITLLSSDRYEYNIGTKVPINIKIKNSEGQPRDIIVAALIKKNREIIDSIPLRELEDLQGIGEVSLEWDTSGISYGRYDIDVEIRDLDGFILDRKNMYITIGIPSVNITSLEVSNTNFTVGENLTFSTSIINNGDTDVSGSLILEIRLSGEIIKTIQHPFNISAGETRSFHGFWDTSPAIVNKTYSLTGYVSYSGMASSPMVIYLTSHEKLRKTPGFEIIILFVVVTFFGILRRIL